MEDIKRLLDRVTATPEFASICTEFSVNVHVLTPTDDIDESWSIERVITERPPKGWEKLFSMPSIRAGAKRIDSKLQEETAMIVPLRCNIFRAYSTPLCMVKVVIIGQDPYHTVINGRPQATGMAFSLWKGAAIQPSLRNIYRQLKNEYPDFNPPNHGDLWGWAQQGVFLLNACFTTVQGVAGAHGQLWRDFVKQTLQLIREERPSTVMLLWGGWAQKLTKDCGALHIIETSHPSDKSCEKGENPFIGSGCFSKCNEHLIKQGIEPIRWDYLP